MFRKIIKKKDAYLVKGRPVKLGGYNADIGAYKHKGNLYFYKPIIKYCSYNHGNEKNWIWSEIVNSEVYQMLGLDAPKYMLAKKDISMGVLSEDVEGKYQNAELLKDYIIRHMYEPQQNLNFLKNTSKLQLDQVSELLDLTVLAHVGIGNEDGHFRNIFVCSNTENCIPTNVSLIDISLTYPSQYSSVSEIKNTYSNHAELWTKFMIEPKKDKLGGFRNSSYEEFYNDLITSPNIATKSIEKYLTNVTKLLATNALYDIKDRLVEEYSLTMSDDMYKSLNGLVEREDYWLRATTKDIERCYDERIIL
ncbi:MAG: hypothetical protein E7361_04060 [Clostridiales bacterium]|nr:hypothetical protein [Clostridiales bacterium]